MLIRQVALVSEVDTVQVGELAQVSAAIQKQVTRDFGPIWEIDATVDAFAALEDVPLGYWPVILVDDLKGAGGVHQDKDGQPFALVAAGASWSLAASHETLEMLADPFGNRVVAGNSPKRRQGRVEFLVEVCDPSEAEQFGYTANGVLVSDFYTPHYFDPAAATGVRYSFGGAITKPRQVLRGGYLSWHDPVTDHWFQETFFGSKPVFRDLGLLTTSSGGNLRSLVDARTPNTQRLADLKPGSAEMKLTASARQASSTSAESKAKTWREQIAALRPAG